MEQFDLSQYEPSCLTWVKSSEPWSWYNAKDLEQGGFCTEHTRKAHIPSVLWRDLLCVTEGEKWARCAKSYRLAMGCASRWILHYFSKEAALEALQQAHKNWIARDGKPLENFPYDHDPDVWLSGEYIRHDDVRMATITVEPRLYYSQQGYTPPTGFTLCNTQFSISFVGPYENLPEDLKLDEPIIVESK